MSHVTTIQTQFSEERFLVQALTDLGYSFNVKGSTISVKYGLLQKLKFQLRDKMFRAEQYEGNRAKMTKLVGELSQRYAYLATVEKLNEMGFELAEEQTTEDSSIHLTLRRIA